MWHKVQNLKSGGVHEVQRKSKWCKQKNLRYGWEQAVQLGIWGVEEKSRCMKEDTGTGGEYLQRRRLKVKDR